MLITLAFLTLILLALALAIVKRSLWLSATAVANGVLWRGEAWKAAFLESQQQQRHILSKTESDYLGRSLPCGDGGTVLAQLFPIFVPNTFRSDLSSPVLLWKRNSFELGKDSLDATATHSDFGKSLPNWKKTSRVY